MHEMFRDVAVIPVLTIARAADAVPLAEALLRGGLRVIEVTLRTPAAAEAIAEIRRRVPDVVVGAGTLLKGADIGRAVAAGARFLVSPGLTPELAAAGLASERPYLPGVVTPSEVMAARDLGLSLLKFFPATGAGGVDTLATYAPVFPGVAFWRRRPGECGRLSRSRQCDDGRRRLDGARRRRRGRRLAEDRGAGAGGRGAPAQVTYF
jgi:2-dehydro-3-deoxyphosphogluconate aldolase/(4S)-4-hydroxy-2-oxoglutarate aldolase